MTLKPNGACIEGEQEVRECVKVTLRQITQLFFPSSLLLHSFYFFCKMLTAIHAWSPTPRLSVLSHPLLSALLISHSVPHMFHILDALPHSRSILSLLISCQTATFMHAVKPGNTS